MRASNPGVSNRLSPHAQLNSHAHLPAHEWHGLPPPRRFWAIAAIWLSMTMAVLDGTIANVALPAIARDIHAAPAEAIWVVNAYQLAIVVSLLPLAALGEVVGYG